MHINGTNFHRGKRVVKESSYYFSNFCHVWGWASWRRAWSRYDVAMKDFETIDKQELRKTISANPVVSSYWLGCLESVYKGKIDTWDYQWYYAFWKNSGIAITPSLNMVSNIGFDEAGTRTVSKYNRFSNMKRFRMDQIVHPAEVTKNAAGDQYTSAQKIQELTPSFMEKVHFKWNLILKDITKSK